MKNLNKRHGMKLSKMDRLEECARYIIEFERDDWENQILENNGELVDHVYQDAVIALLGKKEFLSQLEELKASLYEKI